MIDLVRRISTSARSRRARLWGEVVLPAVVLLTLLSILFWDAVWGGRALLPVDMNFARDSVWRGLGPREFRGPSNYVLSDVAEQFFPWRAYIVYWLSQGELPLWNSGVLAGNSFVGNAQSALFYPVNLLAYLFPLASSFTFTALARLLIAGLSTFGYLRVTGRSRAAAYLGAVAFSLCGWLVASVNYAVVNVGVLLPALLLCLEQVYRTARLRWMAGLAIGIGSQFLGGNLQTSFHVLLTAGAYVLLLTVRSWTRGAPEAACRGLLLSVLGASLGIGIGSLQLLPFVELLSQSTVFAERAGGFYNNHPLYYSAFWRELATGPAIVFPRAFGSPAVLDSGYEVLSTSLPNALEYAAYVGTFPLLLGLIGLWHRRSDARLVFWGATCVLTFAVALRLPLFEVINHLPGFNVVHQERLRLVFSFSAAVLGAGGLDWLLARGISGQSAAKGENRRAVWLAIVGILVAVAALLITYVALTASRERLIDLGIGYLDPKVDEFRQLVRGRVFDWQMSLPLLFAAFLIGLLWLGARRRLNRRLTALVLLILTATELVIAGAGWNPTIDPAFVTPKTPAIDYVRERVGSGRIAGIGRTLIPNNAMIWGLQDVRAYDNVRLSTIWTLLRTVDGHIEYGADDVDLAHVNSPLLDLLGVRYVLADPGSPRPDPTRFRQVFAQTVPSEEGSLPWVNLFVYENLRAMPRAFVVSRARLLASGGEILNVYSPRPRATFDPRTEVLLETAQAPPVEGLQAGDATVSVVSHRPNRVVLRATLEGEGYLVLTDSFDAGWVAEVDGSPAPIYRANYAFRAVRLRPGDHQVEFLFRPWGVLVGLGLTGGSFVGLFGCALWRRQIGWVVNRVAAATSRARWTPRGLILLLGVLVTGPVVSSVYAQWAPPKEGEFLRNPRTGSIEVFREGRRHALNLETLRCRQQPGQPIRNFEALDELPAGPSVENRAGCTLLPPAGALVQPTGREEVYVSSGTALQPVPDRRMLACLAPEQSPEIVALSYIERAPIGPSASVEGCPMDSAPPRDSPASAGTPSHGAAPTTPTLSPTVTPAYTPTPLGTPNSPMYLPSILHGAVRSGW